MMKSLFFLLIIIVLFAIAITFGASNDQIVTFNYLIAHIDLRLSTLLAILFGSGFLVGWVLTSIFLIKIKLNLTTTKYKLNKLQKKYDEELAEQQKNQLTANQEN